MTTRPTGGLQVVKKPMISHTIGFFIGLIAFKILLYKIFMFN